MKVEGEFVKTVEKQRVDRPRWGVLGFGGRAEELLFAAAI